MVLRLRRTQTFRGFKAPARGFSQATPLPHRAVPTEVLWWRSGTVSQTVFSVPYYLDGSGVVWQVWNQLPIAFVNHDAIINYFANARPGTWWLPAEVGNYWLRQLPPSAVFEAIDSSGSFAFFGSPPLPCPM